MEKVPAVCTMLLCMLREMRCFSAIKLAAAAAAVCAFVARI